MNENPQESSETKLNLAIIDQTFDAEQAAHREAVRLRTERLNSGNGFSKFAKGIWDSVAGDYLQLRDSRRALRAIEADGHVQMFDQSTNSAESTRLATIDRFTSEYEETIHAEAGENREILDSENELAVELKQVLRRNIDGTLTDEAAHEESLRILDAYSDSHGVEALKSGKVMTDNFFAIRDAVVGATANNESIDLVLENMTVTVGESRSDVRTEVNYTVVDKLIDKLGKSKFGSLVGPEVVATAATLAGTLLRFGSKKVIGAAALTVAPGAAAGLWAGLKENKKVKDERADHLRDMARGMEFEAGSKRREEMDLTRYEMVEAGTLADELRSRFGEDVNLDDHDTLRSSIDALAAVQARVRMSDQQKIDLISYKDGQVEEQRLALDIALAEAKTIARQRLSPEARTALGLPLDIELNELLNQQAEEFIDSVETDISSKDAAFKKLKRRRVAIASAKGVIIGLTIGAVVQEGIAAFDDTRQGLVEQLWHANNVPFHGEQHQTLLNGIFHGSHGQDVVTHHAAESTYNNTVIGTNGGQYELSADHNLVNNGNGTLDLVDKSGNVSVDNLPVNADGSLPQSSIDILHSHGMSVIDTSHNVDIATTQTTSVSVDQYITNHPDQVTRITRDGWYDNNTPHIYDRNELGLHWGGAAGSDGHGGYAMSVATMTKGGSFSGNHSVDWSQQAHNGNLQLAISGSKGTQSEVFMVNIGPDGKIDIPAGSPAAQFFSTENGHTTFNGAYAEVVQKTGIDANGVEHVRPLATLVGHNNVGHIPDTVTTHTTELKPEYQITTNGYDTTENFSSFTEMAPVIPVTSRRSMENLRHPRGREGYGYYGGESEPLNKDDISPRLWENPNADLNPQEELQWYKKQLRKKRGSKYVKDIESAVANVPELANLPPSLKTIVTIPVGASGDIEANGIYDLLTKAYGSQDRGALAESLVLLHVNWIDDRMNDPQKRANVERTKAEIARAKADLPYMNIAVMETEFKQSEVIDGVIGHVSSRMNDAAMLAVEAAMSRGEVSSTQEVLLLRNDADAKGMSKNYLKHMTDTAQAQKETDIFTGLTSFDNTKASRLPGFVFASNFMQSLNIISSMREGKVHTGGANFGVRLSTFAAVGGTTSADGYTGVGSDDVNIGRRISQVRTRQGYTNNKTISSYVHNLYHGKPSSASTAGYSSSPVATRKIAQRVIGARIDTDSDREEAMYAAGKPMIQTWNNGAFDVNGYSDRNAGLGANQTKEVPLSDSDGVAERIRNDMQGTMDNYGPESESIIRSSLALMFVGLKGHSSTEAYTLSFGPRGCKFEFTKIGKEHLISMLTRDGKGRFDHYGSRKMRQMYGESKTSARRQPTHQSMIKV